MNGASAGRARGFTLIELMVVVAVIAILATIVFPIYENYIRNVRRGDARTAALAVAMAQERFFTVNGRYNATPASIFQDPTSPYRGGNSEKGYYTYTIAPGLIDTSTPNTCNRTTATCNSVNQCFTVTVNPVGTLSQGSDGSCTRLCLDSSGQQRGERSGTLDMKCW
jgi:type IV pilus assembly protein PilE